MTYAFTVAVGNATHLPLIRGMVPPPSRLHELDSVSIALTVSGRKPRLWHYSSTTNTVTAAQPSFEVRRSVLPWRSSCPCSALVLWCDPQLTLMRLTLSAYFSIAPRGLWCQALPALSGRHASAL